MISRFRRLGPILIISIVAVIFAAMNLTTLQAQTFQAQVTGTVRDSSGAVIPGAKVTAKNLGTGIIVTATSNDTGSFTLTNLRPADYMITCEVKGFKRFEQSPVTLQVNQVLEVEIGLQPGSVTEQVNVDGVVGAPGDGNRQSQPGGDDAQHCQPAPQHSRSIRVDRAHAGSRHGLELRPRWRVGRRRALMVEWRFLRGRGALGLAGVSGG